MKYLLTKVDYGYLGACLTETTEKASRREIAENLAHGEYDRATDMTALGLCAVFEIDTEAGTCIDITPAICKQAEHYIMANEMSAYGNVVRLLVSTHVLPEWVSAIVEGVAVAADLERAA